MRMRSSNREEIDATGVDPLPELGEGAWPVRGQLRGRTRGVRAARVGDKAWIGISGSSGVIDGSQGIEINIIQELRMASTVVETPRGAEPAGDAEVAGPPVRMDVED